MGAYNEYKQGNFTSPISSEADKPVRSASAMKGIFDSNSNELKATLNALIDILGADKDSYDEWKAALENLLTPDQAATLAAAIIVLQNGKENKLLRFGNTLVDKDIFISDATYDDYPYRAAVPLTGVLSTMDIDVRFDVIDSISGIFAPVATSYDGGVYLYSTDVPDADITIPRIICM